MSIRLENFLSFGPQAPSLDLRPLNILIGPNGSGKSNLLRPFGYFNPPPETLPLPEDRVADWVWKGTPEPAAASIEVVVGIERQKSPLRYLLQVGPPRVRQKTDVLGDFPAEDGHNLQAATLDFP